MTQTVLDLATLNVHELGRLNRRAAAALAARRNDEARAELATCLTELGVAMGLAWTDAWAPERAVVEAEPDLPGRYDLEMFAITESTPGPQWRGLFDVVWPAYRTWYLSEGEAARPALDTGRRMLARHMPELLPTWTRLVELSGDDELAARMLTMWNLPQFLPGCSQAVLGGPEPALLRNYDYSPELFERVVYSSAFTGRRVIGTGDCLWGLLDGMNDAGLAVSLAFGGRPGSGPGFAVPLVVRYLLEVCDSLASVRAALSDLPVSMSYNLTVVDATGDTMTAFVAPDQPAEFSPAAVATNHRGTVPEYPEHARALRSVERQELLVDLLDREPTVAELTTAFQTAPLYSTGYSRAFGTLYTVVYRPTRGYVDYVWPDVTWRRDFGSPSGVTRVVLREG
jgi:predicted choloylglycine hydrolase